MLNIFHLASLHYIAHICPPPPSHASSYLQITLQNWPHATRTSSVLTQECHKSLPRTYISLWPILFFNRLVPFQSIYFSCSPFLASFPSYVLQFILFQSAADPDSSSSASSKPYFLSNVSYPSLSNPHLTLAVFLLLASPASLLEPRVLSPASLPEPRVIRHAWK